MYGLKIRFNLVSVVVAVVINIAQGHAGTLLSLSNKTYTLTFQGVPGEFHFYIDTAGRVFQYAREPCASVGSFAKLNASNRGQFSCPNGPGLVSYTAMATLSGSTITYERSADVRSNTGALTHSTWRWVFSTDGDRCDAIPVLFNNQSFAAISCKVRAGRPPR